MTTQTLGKGGMDAWGERARQVKLLGLNRAPAAEIGAVHAALYPSAPAVKTYCRQCVADAFQTILRYLRTQTETSLSSTPTASTAMKKSLTYQFSDPKQTYRPHNSPVVYSNDNLTDARVASILTADPAAAAHFGISEEEGQEFVASHAAEVAALAAATTPGPGGSTPPNEPNVATNKLADTNSDYYKEEYAKLDALKRDELDTLYTDEVKEGVAKDFANKAEVIKAILAHRAK